MLALSEDFFWRKSLLDLLGWVSISQFHFAGAFISYSISETSCCLRWPLCWTRQYPQLQQETTLAGKLYRSSGGTNRDSDILLCFQIYKEGSFSSQETFASRFYSGLQYLDIGHIIKSPRENLIWLADGILQNEIFFASGHRAVSKFGITNIPYKNRHNTLAWWVRGGSSNGVITAAIWLQIRWFAENICTICRSATFAGLFVYLLPYMVKRGLVLERSQIPASDSHPQPWTLFYGPKITLRPLIDRWAIKIWH